MACFARRRQTHADCFFCRTPAVIPVSQRSWTCRACGESNGPIRMAGIVPASSEGQHLAPTSQCVGQRPSLDSFPAPFCSTCLRNQQIVAGLMAEYVPPAASHASAEDADEATSDASRSYRMHLETRYPPVCASCAPRVQQTIARNNRQAKVLTFAAALASPHRSVRKPVISPQLISSLTGWAGVRLLNWAPVGIAMLWITRLVAHSRTLRAALQAIPPVPLWILIVLQSLPLLSHPSGVNLLSAVCGLLSMGVLLSPSVQGLYARWFSSDETLLSYEGAVYQASMPRIALGREPSELPAILVMIVLCAALLQVVLQLLHLRTTSSYPPSSRVGPRLVHHPASSFPSAAVQLPPAPVSAATPVDPLMASWGLDEQTLSTPTLAEEDKMDWEPDPATAPASPTPSWPTVSSQQHRRTRTEPLLRPQTFFPPGTQQAQRTGLEDWFGRAVAVREEGTAPEASFPCHPRLSVAVAVLLALVAALAVGWGGAAASSDVAREQ